MGVADDLGVAAATYVDPTPAPGPAPNSPQAVAQATEFLAREGAKFRSNIADPSARMSAMLNDENFLARMRQGNAEAQAEWGKTLAEATVRANTPEIERLGRQDMRERGFGDKAADEVINGATFSPEQVRTAQASKQLALADKDWTERYMRGDAVEMHDMTMWNAIIASAIEG
jgi:hypothetical protein